MQFLIKKVNVSFIIIFFLVFNSLYAKEGMWIPILLEKYNLAEMQEMGFRLSANDIYDINNASMKDAVVLFDGGCTGVLVSGEGLLITNHHCGYSNIQSHSTVENDYLTDGFWAMNKEEELPNPGLNVRILEYMIEVTNDVLSETHEHTGVEKENKIFENIVKIETEASKDGRFLAQVKPLFYANQYHLYVYKVYHDVRLVGAPPSAIGKFGGNTDNWMWPRHTGDFALFRVYADENNEPADYSPDNVPYEPKKYLPISLKGVQQGDFTMVLGNPGSTMQYIPSYEVDIIMNQRNPDRIGIRDKKLEIIEEGMEIDPHIRIQYASKYARVSNAWKKWKGEILGLERLDAVNRKREFEENFKNYAKVNGTWENIYQEVFDNFDSLYFIYENFIKASDYYSEIVFRGIEIFTVASRINRIISSIEHERLELLDSQLKSDGELFASFFKDYNQRIDEKLFQALLPMLTDDLIPEFLPDHVSKVLEKHDSEKLIKKVYQKSLLPDYQKMKELLEEGDEKKLLKLKNDPLVKLYNRLNFHYEITVKPMVDTISKRLNRNMKIYMRGIMEMKEEKALYPDANGTLRLTYGKVEGYEPKDGVRYKHFTTMEGIIEKNDPDIYDYDVPDRLRELFENKDFGKYTDDGYMPVCFTASNHTTGGNSGSPVLNASGHLIGLNFDRCWEGTMSDIMYDPEMCRNIAVDMRYVLFIIDKFANAGYLLEEMEVAEERDQCGSAGMQECENGVMR